MANKDKKNRVWLWMIIAFAVVALAVITYFLVSSQSNAMPASSSSSAVNISNSVDYNTFQQQVSNTNPVGNAPPSPGS